jgi:hypothetical protein
MRASVRIAIICLVVAVNRDSIRAVAKDLIAHEDEIKSYLKKRADGLRSEEFKSRFTKFWGAGIGPRLEKMNEIDWGRITIYVPQHAKRAADRIIASFERLGFDPSKRKPS